jgi:hypothetical protein
MLNLKPLIAGLVEDVLRAIAEATLEELGAVGTSHRGAPKPARSTRRSRGRAAPRRGPSRASRLASPAHMHSLPDDALEPPEFDAITNPEDLLVATGHCAVAEPFLASNVTVDNEESTEDEEEVPPSRVQPVDRPTPVLRAGESVVRATAAGVVIRRPRSR